MSLAVESIVKISIEWGASTVVYADKTDTGEKGALLDFDVVSLQGRVGDVGSIGSVNVTLDDTDGTLKTLYDTDKIEGRKCTVTQVFTGGVTHTRMLLVGRICADIIWSEGDRTLKFGIESIFADNQIGYAPKLGDYAWLHPDAIGIPWPICFGSVLRVPAIRVLKPYDLKLGEDVKYNDPSPFIVVGGDYVPQSPTSMDISIGEILFRGTMSGENFTPTIWNMPKYTNVTLVARPTSDADYSNPSVFWIANPNISLLRHYCLVCYDGSNYTVNRVIHQEGTKCWCVKPWDQDLLLDDSLDIDEVARYPRTSWPETQTIEMNGETFLTIAKDGWTLYKDAIVYYQPVSGITDRYICNLVTSEEVVEVYAHRKFFGQRIFCAVPTSYYTLNLDEDLSGRHVTSITMDQPLSSRYCEGWEDDLYVSLVSSISPPVSSLSSPGGNTSEIIEWILDTYTDLAIDSTSFNNVAALIDDTPSNFAIFDQPNAVEVCQEIAWQARCALVIVSGIAYLKFLADGYASPVETLTNILTELKTINLGLTPTEDIITKIKAKWIREYSGEKIGVDGQNPERTLEKERNVSEYGLHELEKNYFIYNIGANVDASIEFWLRRLSSVWKTIGCNAFIDINDVTIFDYMQFNISGLNFPVGGAIGQLTYIGHNTGEPIVELQATLAIKAGTIVHSSDFWYTVGGSAEDVLNGLATSDYIIASDESCPDWVSILSAPSPKYHFVFTESPKRIPRGVAVKLEAEIQDGDGNLITSIDPAFAILEIHSADRFDVPNHAQMNMTFVGGKWNNDGVPIIITGGDKHTTSHLWIKSLDSRIFSSKRQIGSE